MKFEQMVSISSLQWNYEKWHFFWWSGHQVYGTWVKITDEQSLPSLRLRWTNIFPPGGEEYMFWHMHRQSTAQRGTRFSVWMLGACSCFVIIPTLVIYIYLVVHNITLKDYITNDICQHSTGQSHAHVIEATFQYCYMLLLKKYTNLISQILQ